MEILFSEIDGVNIFPVRTIPDERGTVFKPRHAPFQVNDVYATTVRHGAIKAWHGYETKSLYWTVLSGLVKLALYDNRPQSPTYKIFETIYLGEDSNYSVLVPPGVYNGFKGITTSPSIVLVQADELYNQIYRLPYDSLDYDWNISNG